MKTQSIPCNTQLDATSALYSVRQFMCTSQKQAIKSACYGEERQFFADMLVSLSDLIATMPETYGQDGKGNQAIAYLHYFRGGNDWYITEKDSDPEGDGQIQSFGIARFNGHEPELGYISIAELVVNDVELDLYFTPQTLETINGDES